MLAPAGGEEPTAPETVDLGSGRAVAEAVAAGAQPEGALYLFEAVPGVVVMATVSNHPGEREALRELALAMLDSLEFTGTIEALFEAIDQPPGAVDRRRLAKARAVHDTPRD